MQHYPLVLKPSFRIRNQIINEDKYNRDIDNFKPKDQIRVLQSYMPMSEIKQRLTAQRLNVKHNLQKSFKNLKQNIENPYRQLGWMGGNPFISYSSGFNLTALKAYYQFNEFYLPAATFDSNFSQYADQTAFDAAWVPTDTAKIRGNPSTDVIDCNIVRDSSADIITYDLGAGNISDTVWALRIQFNSTTITTDPVFYLGLSDSTASNATSQDWIGLMLRPAAASAKVAGIKSDHNNANLLTVAASSNTTLSNSTTYYLQIERVSATLFKISIYTDSTYQTLLTTFTASCESTISALQYIKFMNYSNDTTGDSWTGTITYAKFYNSINPVLQNRAGVAGSGDSLGTAADGSLNGGLSVVAGKIDNAYDFNGSTGYAQLGSSLSQWNFLHNTSALFTLAFWMKADAWNADDYVIANVNTTGVIGFVLRASSSNRFEFAVTPSSGVVIDALTSNSYMPDTTNWYFYVIRWDYSLGSANFKIRRNDGNEETANKTGTATNSNASYPLLLARNPASSANFGSIKLDEMSIWNRILTSAEETALYNSGNGMEIK